MLFCGCFKCNGYSNLNEKMNYIFCSSEDIFEQFKFVVELLYVFLYFLVGNRTRYLALS